MKRFSSGLFIFALLVIVLAGNVEGVAQTRTEVVTPDTNQLSEGVPNVPASLAKTVSRYEGA